MIALRENPMRVAALMGSGIRTLLYGDADMTDSSPGPEDRPGDDVNPLEYMIKIPLWDRVHNITRFEWPEARSLKEARDKLAEVQVKWPAAHLVRVYAP